MKKHDYGIEYETLDELLAASPIRVYTDGLKYYIRLRPESLYDNAMWVVDKKTKKVSYMDHIEFMVEIYNKGLAKEVAVNEIEKT